MDVLERQKCRYSPLLSMTTILSSLSLSFPVFFFVFDFENHNIDTGSALSERDGQRRTGEALLPLSSFDSFLLRRICDVAAAAFSFFASLEEKHTFS